MSRKTGFAATAAAFIMVAAIGCGSDAPTPPATNTPLLPIATVEPTAPAVETPQPIVDPTPTVQPTAPTNEPPPVVEPIASPVLPTPTAVPTPTAEPTPTPAPTATPEPTPTIEPTSPVFQDEVVFEYDFEEDGEGWETGFADLPENYNPEIYELESGYRALPSELSGSGIYLQGHNRSDDLFMFMMKQVSDLKPSTEYEIDISIDLVTNVPGGLMGIGGSPGESVFVKVGAASSEPVVSANAAGLLIVSVDKGHQSNGGTEMVVIGNVASEDVVDDDYKIKSMGNRFSPLTVTSNADGDLWLIIGTDSGFEGLSALYYSNVRYDLTIAK